MTAASPRQDLSQPVGNIITKPCRRQHAVQHKANSDFEARCWLRCRLRANDREATLNVLTAGPAE
ncbi:uncharacterized protein BDW47DRAFT_107901 [Aspergillus candidus]|uniref:Uncharacterized protein n=1 Tax=Aspergillus candidus TaxID=41067 RepID=A0A2I2F8F3_ASPCN|nr:hypothetical protein BDW47DRAFT_107901 [Aspergillus candidus]PLB36899.1 hypothetical protein BDW47DRAFT_107901 [Aspergillus candidus]